ncbi:MAG TPA: twin-arginine translocase TatA/TatE family subunit [Longimicrobium sp.]|nr:twin-arginine translocase TatA/TatE family subunit [Longimicrobium sp.]
MGLGLGPFELILVFAVMLLMFGAKRLPELASGMGKGIRGFKQALNGVEEQSAADPSAQAPPASPAPARTALPDPLSAP